MFRISHANHAYAWGSQSAIHEIFGDPTPGPIAEAWMGAHPSAPSHETGAGGRSLPEIISSDVDAVLGADVAARFGPTLPYLLKVIAAERPLSLQVHPNLAHARAGCDKEDRAGVPRDAPERNYRDSNHKPELVYA